MVLLVVGLLHPREQASAQRLSPVCQHWYSRNGDGVVITHSTKYNFVCVSYCQTGMPHLAGIFDDRMDDCGIYFDEMMRFYSSTLE